MEDKDWARRPAYPNLPTQMCDAYPALRQLQQWNIELENENRELRAEAKAAWDKCHQIERNLKIRALR